MTGYGATGVNDGTAAPGERGYRRMRLAAMAGSLYRSGQQAVSDMREQYAQTRSGMDAGGDGHGRTSIPGAFPDVGIKVHGGEQLVLFPSYAKTHIKKDWSRLRDNQAQERDEPPTGEDFWKQEWEKNEDEKAIVDVDVRGWVYSPHVGPMTRRNRMLIGLARQLSGISAPKADTAYDSSDEGLRAQHQMHEAQREQERIEREAAQIERRGREEGRVAYHGGYSERPQLNVESMQTYRAQARSASRSAPGSPTLGPSQYSTGLNELTEAELAVANANLMARIAPFMTNPIVAIPITVFFYNDSHSQSRTVITNDAGHFNLRAPLDFVPTHVRVLANESLSAIQEVKITEPHGISLISDVDDTVKRSNISGGAKEIFRNTFIRELKELGVEGVKEWYDEMYRMGVNIHYCSNSPWQLYPVLGTFFKISGLPPGSLHLKQYSGMLQGIFEPVAERKKTTLDRLFRDFPERKFLLVGDSGEADLEVYTELAVSNPGRVLAIFIRDVTTPENMEFFESSFEVRRQASNPALDESRGQRSVARRQSSSNASTGERKQQQRQPQSSGPLMGDLIDLSDEPAQMKEADGSPAPGKTPSELLSARKPPPPRPAKPAALRSAPSHVEANGLLAAPSQADGSTPPQLPTRKAPGGSVAGAHPLAQTQNSSDQKTGGSSRITKRNPGSPAYQSSSPPPPPPPRRGTAGSIKSNLDVEFEPLPPPSSTPAPAPLSGRSSVRSPAASPAGSPNLGPQGGQGLNRKLELWIRRLERAHEQLDRMGVMLYTWRRGQDVSEEAAGIVKRAQGDMARGRRNR